MNDGCEGCAGMRETIDAMMEQNELARADLMTLDTWDKVKLDRIVEALNALHMIGRGEIGGPKEMP